MITYYQFRGDYFRQIIELQDGQVCHFAQGCSMIEEKHVTDILRLAGMNQEEYLLAIGKIDARLTTENFGDIKDAINSIIKDDPNKGNDLYWTLTGKPEVAAIKAIAGECTASHRDIVWGAWF